MFYLYQFVKIKPLKNRNKTGWFYRCHGFTKLHFTKFNTTKETFRLKLHSVSRVNNNFIFFCLYIHVLNIRHSCIIVSRQLINKQFILGKVKCLYYFEGNCYGKYVALLFITCSTFTVPDIQCDVLIRYVLNKSCSHNSQIIARKLCQCQVR